jgi:hypothetical protein
MATGALENPFSTFAPGKDVDSGAQPLSSQHHGIDAA